MFWRITTFLAVFLCAAVALAGKVRTWTSTDGRTMQAEFVRELDGEVTFIKDGKLIVIKLEKLSANDQQIVKELAAGKEPEEDPFTTTPATPRGEKPAETPAENPAEPAGEKPDKKKPITIQSRTWTDRFGNKASGKYVRMDGNDVVINRGTRVTTLAFGNLSDADQEYVRNVLISQGKKDDIPSTVGGFAGAIGGGGNFPGGNGLAPAGGFSGPGMVPPLNGPTAQPGIGLPPGGGMPSGAPQGLGGRGVRGRGPRMGTGIGMPPGIGPPVATGPMGMGPMGMGPMGMGPAGTGLSGGGLGDSIAANSGMAGASGLAGSGGMPTLGMGPGMMPLPPTGTMTGPALPAPGAMPSFPGARMPAMEPASIPPIHGPSFPGVQIDEYFECSKCKAKLTKVEASGSTCPRCQTTWGFKQDEFGNKTMTAAGRSQISSVGATIVIFVLLGTVVFIALFVGIIVAIVKAAAPARPQEPMPQQQRYY